MPFAFLSCLAAAAALYLARVTREVGHYEYLGLFFIGISAFAAVCAVRRARGMPLWDRPPMRRERLLLTQATAVLAGLGALELGTLVMMFMDRGVNWLPSAPIFALSALVSIALHSGMTLVLIAMSLGAAAYLSHASGIRGLMLTYFLGADLGVLYGPGMLPRDAQVAAGWPHAGAIIGALIGLIMASAFWIMDDGAVAATQKLERGRRQVAIGLRTISPAAWAGFRRMISLALALLVGILMTIPIVLFGPGQYLVLFYLAPLYLVVPVPLFIICVRVARAAKRSVHYRDVEAFRRGGRVAICALTLFMHGVWLLNLWVLR